MVEPTSSEEAADDNSSRSGSAPNDKPEHESETAAAATTTSTPEAINSNSLETIMESVVRVTLAGLGGSVVGLSQERRLESMRVVTGAAATAAARKRRSPQAMLSNLPLTWALSCMAFCAIIETSRLTSPSTWLVNELLEARELVPEAVLGDGRKKYATTILDYTIGGGVAGLAGSFGRNSHLRQRLPSAMFQGTRRFFGVLPGIALGMAAGTLQAATDYGVEYLEHLSTNADSSH